MEREVVSIATWAEVIRYYDWDIVEPAMFSFYRSELSTEFPDDHSLVIL